MENSSERGNARTSKAESEHVGRVGVERNFTEQQFDARVKFAAAQWALRQVLQRTVFNWMRDDLGMACKMTMTPAQTDKLVDAILDRVAPAPSGGVASPPRQPDATEP